MGVHADPLFTDAGVRTGPLPATRSGNSGAAAPRLGHAGQADAFHVPVVRSTASAEHVDMRKAAPEIAVLGAQLYGVADVQLGRIVELRVAAPGGICA